MKSLYFNGSGGEYFKIWIVNIFLTIITFGLYYPWAKVRNYKYFYRNSEFEDRSFDYHATGKQLFLGYLIALILFVGFTIVQNISPEGSLILLGVLFLAIPWLIWKSLIFNLRVTSFSNVRFSFKGTLFQTYLNYLAIPALLFFVIYSTPILLISQSLSEEEATAFVWIDKLIPYIFVIVTLLAFYLFAFMKKRNNCFLINNRYYGNIKFETKLHTVKFAEILLKTIGLNILLLIVIVSVGALFVNFTSGFEIFSSLQSETTDPELIEQNFAMIAPAIVLIYGLLVFGSLLIFSYYKTRERTYLYESTTLDNQVRFKSTLKARSLAWVMMTNLLMIMVTFGLAFPWAKVRVAKIMLENTLIDTDGNIDNYFDTKEKEGSSLGEQIGDAFDVDMGVGF